MKTVTINNAGVLTSYSYNEVVITGDQTAFICTGVVPTPVPPQPIPVPPSPCTTRPNMVFLPAGQQQFVTAGAAVLSYEVPEMPQGQVKITKMSGTPTDARVTIWFSRCAGVVDDLSKQPGYTVTFNHNGGPLYYTHGTGDFQYMKVPTPAYVNFSCSVTSPYVIQRNP